MIKATDITLRVWWDDAVYVGDFATGDIADWNWNAIVYQEVPSVQFVSVIETTDEIKGI